LLNHCYIYYASPPLRPIEGVRGIYLSNYLILNSKWDVYIYSKYLLYLGPGY
jgi:hypothetical protein